jgi:hypothetical protein
VHLTTRRRRIIGLLCVLAGATACGSSGNDTEPETSTGVTTVDVEADTTTVDTTTVDTTTVDTTTVESTTTLEVVKTTVLGTVVGGNAGGIGADQTQSESEMVKDGNGGCTGWDGRSGGLWTDDVRGGTPLMILGGRDGPVLAEGVLGDGVAQNVDEGRPGGNWQCSFDFQVDDVPQAAEYWVKVGRQDPWKLNTDPTRPGVLVASVSTIASAATVSACQESPSGQEVGSWSAAGNYWSEGISSVCAAGLVVADIVRPCRPPKIASDSVIAVLSATDPYHVYEDLSGLQVDPATLEVGTPVIVSVATGRPCPP